MEPYGLEQVVPKQLQLPILDNIYSKSKLNLVGGFNPFEKYDITYIYINIYSHIYSQNENLPQIGVKNNKYLSCHPDVQ